MAVAFKIKVKHYGASQIEQYVTKKGKVFTEVIKGAIENDVVNVAGRNILATAKQRRERTLFMAAVFFQRVVNRTPKDECYVFEKRNGSEEVHSPDGDYVRNAWTASYNHRKVTAEQLIDAGLTFKDFNDETEIRKIYEVFKKAFVQNKKNILQIHIENNHERFPMLEYGEYRKDSREIKRGEWYSHGVRGGFTVQAPHGMLRITEAEFQTMVLNNKSKFISEYLNKYGAEEKVPSKQKMEELKKIIMNKSHLYEEDLSVIERIYGI